MAHKLSLAEKVTLAILEDNLKGTLNAARIYSRLPKESKIGKDAIHKALLSLTAKGKAEQPSKGNFRYAQPTILVEGRIEFTRKGDAFVLPSNTAQGLNDIMVARELLANALPGDLVLCEVLRQGRKPFGRISKVLEHYPSRWVGTLDVFDNTAFLVPDKGSFPVDIRLNQKVDKAQAGMKAVVEITGYPVSSRNPEGRIIEILGKPGANDTEMHAIVAEFGFVTIFTDEVLAELSSIPEELTQGEKWPQRRDYREVLTFTIDPEDAKDFDDAISYQKLPNGTIEIGVHIADVSHYVLPGTALDAEALNRATSVYLADRTIPMLPEKLSNNLCSLKPNVDRLAFSAVFVVDAKCQILERWFGKTVIHSRRRFSYEDAQERIVSGKGDLAAELQHINALAEILTEARRKNGAMGFESAEVRFKMDAQGKPLEIYLKKRFAAHKLIEEFMLMANREVAHFVKTVHKPELPFIYRTHGSPSPEKLLDLSQFAQLFGYKIDVNSEKQLRHSINKLLQDVEGKPEADVLTQAAIRSMAKAIYTASKTEHFGLAFDFYTHFTSPIRRYPDLLAHRLLHFYLQKEKTNYNTTQIEAIAKHSSNMEQKASEAERASTKYKMAEYLRDHIGFVFDAVVSGVTDFGIFAVIIENHCEGMIRLGDMKGDHYVFLEHKRKVVGKRSRRSFSIGDVISIRVKNANPQSRMIDFTLAD